MRHRSAPIPDPSPAAGEGRLPAEMSGVIGLLRRRGVVKWLRTQTRPTSRTPPFAAETRPDATAATILQSANSLTPLRGEGRGGGPQSRQTADARRGGGPQSRQAADARNTAQVKVSRRRPGGRRSHDESDLSHHDRSPSHHDNALSHHERSPSHHDNALSHHERPPSHHDNAVSNDERPPGHHDNALSHHEGAFPPLRNARPPLGSALFFKIDIAKSQIGPTSYLDELRGHKAAALVPRRVGLFETSKKERS